MATTFDGRWQAGIGDPTIVGWTTVVAYGLAAWYCYLCQKNTEYRPQRTFWLGMALLMAILGVNKQLDLQTWFTQTGREIAIEYGWYERRRLIQMLFIAWLAIGAIVASSWIKRVVHSLDVHAKAASLGAVLLALFIVARAASFHHIDKLLGFSIDSVSVNAVLELAGIAVVALSARTCLRGLLRKRESRFSKTIPRL
jgi:hypothetical protein